MIEVVAKSVANNRSARDSRAQAAEMCARGSRALRDFEPASIGRRDFIVGSTAFALAPVFAANGRPLKTPLMLDTKRMAIWDGPGMRTTFFVKGCPPKCIWCHNPESISTEPQLARFQHLCKHCAKCTMDEATCPMRALKKYGKPMTLEAIVNRHRCLNTLGISEKQIVDLESHDYARSKYLALGMTDTMPPKPTAQPKK